MAESTNAKDVVLHWPTALDALSVVDAKRELERALAKLSRRKTKRILKIEASSRHDHFARQLVAAARHTPDVEVVATALDGAWDDVLRRGADK